MTKSQCYHDSFEIVYLFIFAENIAQHEKFSRNPVCSKRLKILFAHIIAVRTGDPHMFLPHS